MLQLYINLRLTSMFVFVFLCIPCDVSTNNYESLILWGKWNLNLECNRLPMKHTCNVKKLSDLNNVCKFISLISVHVGSPVWLKRWIRQPHVYISTLFFRFGAILNLPYYMKNLNKYNDLKILMIHLWCVAVNDA